MRIEDVITCPVCQATAPDANRDAWSCTHCGATFPDGHVPCLIPNEDWGVGAQTARRDINDFYRRRIERGDGWWLDRTPYRAVLRHHDIEVFRRPIIEDIARHYGAPLIVDAGGGDGWFLKLCEDRIPDMAGILIDLSDVLMEAGIERNNFRNVHAFCGSIDHIPLRQEIADVVVAIEVLEHVRHPEAFFASVFRVLRPGGRFILTTPNPMSYALWHEEGGIAGVIKGIPPMMMGKVPAKQAEVREDHGVLERYLTPRQITRLGKHVGFGRVVHTSPGIGLAPKPYYWAERLKVPIPLLKTYCKGAVLVERKAVFPAFMPYGKVQRVTCIK